MKRTLKFIGGLFVLLLSLGVYYFSACRTNPGYADSDEFITAGYSLGAVHPSGYPLLILLLKLFMLLPIPGTMAFRANLLSSAGHGFTVLFIYLIGLECLRSLPPLLKTTKADEEGETEVELQSKQEILQVIAAAGGSLILAFSALFWLYASISEAWALNNLIASIVIFLALKWRRMVLDEDSFTRKEGALFILTGVFTGIGLSHHQSFVFLLPGLAVTLFLTLWQQKRWRYYTLKRDIVLLASFAAGYIVPNLLQLWYNARQQNVSWYFEQSLNGWLGQLTRKVYSGYIPEKGKSLGAYIIKDFNLNTALSAFPSYWQFLSEHFVVIGLIFGLLGLMFLLWKQKQLFFIILTFILFPGIIFSLYMGVPENTSNNLEYRSLLGVSHRQTILGETIWAIAIIIGIWGLLQLYVLWRKNLHYAQSLLIMMLIVIIGYMAWDNHTMGVQRDNKHAWNYARTVLNQVPENSVILCFADFSCFSMMYMQEVEGLRPDVALLSKNIYIKHYFIQKHPEYVLKENTDNPYFSADVISWNLAQNRNVYISDAVGYYITFIGMEGNPFFLVPEGYLFKVVKKVPDQVGSYTYPISVDLINTPKSPKDYWANGQLDYFANFHTLTAMIYSYLNMKDEARSNFQLAIKMAPSYQLAVNLYNSLAGYSGNPNYHLGQESSTSAQLVTSGIEKLKRNQIDAGYSDLLKATFMDPRDKQARYTLAELYKQGGYFNEAMGEYKLILKLYPEETLAQQNIQSLEINLAGKR